VNSLDLTVLKLEQVEILQRMVPNEQEVKELLYAFPLPPGNFREI